MLFVCLQFLNIARDSQYETLSDLKQKTRDVQCDYSFGLKPR